MSQLNVYYSSILTFFVTMLDMSKADLAPEKTGRDQGPRRWEERKATKSIIH